MNQPPFDSSLPSPIAILLDLRDAGGVCLQRQELNVGHRRQALSQRFGRAGRSDVDGLDRRRLGRTVLGGRFPLADSEIRFFSARLHGHRRLQKRENKNERKQGPGLKIPNPGSKIPRTRAAKTQISESVLFDRYRVFPGKIKSPRRSACVQYFSVHPPSWALLAGTLDLARLRHALQLTADHHLLDLGRPFIESQDAHIAIETLDGVIGDIA